MRCTSFGARCLKTSAGVLLAQRHQQDGGVFDALVVHGGAPCSCAQAASPPTQPDDAGHRGRVLLREGARAGQLVVHRRRGQRRRRGRARQRRAGVVVGDHVELAAHRLLAGVERGLQRRADEPEHHQQRHQRQRQRHRGGAHQVVQPGLLVQRQSRRPSAAASTRNGALMTLHRIAALLVEAEALLHQRGELLQLVGRQRRARGLALGVGDAAVVDHHRGVQPLARVPVALRVTRTVLSTS